MFTHARFVFSLSLLAPSQAGALHKLLSNFLTTFSISSNVLHSEQFSLVFDQFWNIWAAFSAQNWPCLHTSQCFSRQFMNFLWKRSQILSPLPRSPARADHGRKVHAAGPLGQRFFFWRKLKMTDEDSHSTDTSVSSAVRKVFLTTISLAHNRSFTRLILILIRGLRAPDYAAKLH